MIVGRYAPSPSGRMHLGNIGCCLLAWLSAKSKGGKIVLRIEDLDAARCPRAYADLLEQDLAWLGLAPDEGGSAGGPNGPYYQSECTELYQAAFDDLKSRGLVYPCFCTRSQLNAAVAPHGEDGHVVYPGTCRKLTPEEVAARAAQQPPAWRLRVPNLSIVYIDGHMGRYSQQMATECGDFIIRRADGVFAYQLAVVVDDGRMGVTEVVRGMDLRSSTPRQAWIYGLLGLTPPQFFHAPMLLAPDGRRLSKRDGDVSLETLQKRYTPEQIIGKLAYLYNLQDDDEPRTPQDLLKVFSWQRIPTWDLTLPPDLF